MGRDSGRLAAVPLGWAALLCSAVLFLSLGTGGKVTRLVLGLFRRNIRHQHVPFSSPILQINAGLKQIKQIVIKINSIRDAFPLACRYKITPRPPSQKPKRTLKINVFCYGGINFQRHPTAILPHTRSRRALGGLCPSPFFSTPTPANPTHWTQFC